MGRIVWFGVCSMSAAGFAGAATAVVLVAAGAAAYAGYKYATKE